MNRIDRISAILVQLQSRKIVKAQDIADRFEISLRTVYRDVKTLEEAGVPIIGEAGAGYRIMDGYRLPPVMFTKEEATAFITAEKLVAKFTDEATVRRYSDAMYKVRSVLRSDEKGMLENIENVIQIYKYNKMPDNSYMYDLLKSISDKKAVEMSYRANYTGENTNRVIEPVGIYFIGNYWHLVAWCTLRNDYRDFRLDRIKGLKHTNINFVQEKLSLTEYMVRYTNRNQLVKVVVVFDKQVVPYINDQKFYFGYADEEDNGSTVKMTFLTPSISYFAKWLISYGKKVQVESPSALKDEMCKFIKELQEHYL